MRKLANMPFDYTITRSDNMSPTLLQLAASADRFWQCILLACLVLAPSACTTDRSEPVYRVKAAFTNGSYAGWKLETYSYSYYKYGSIFSGHGLFVPSPVIVEKYYLFNASNKPDILLSNAMFLPRRNGSLLQLNDDQIIILDAYQSAPDTIYFSLLPGLVPGCPHLRQRELVRDDQFIEPDAEAVGVVFGKYDSKMKRVVFDYYTSGGDSDALRSEYYLPDMFHLDTDHHRPPTAKEAFDFNGKRFKPFVCN